MCPCQATAHWTASAACGMFAPVEMRWNVRPEARLAAAACLVVTAVLSCEGTQDIRPSTSPSAVLSPTTPPATPLTVVSQTAVPGRRIAGMVSTGGTLWISNGTSILTLTGTALVPIAGIGASAEAIAPAGDGVWCADPADGKVIRVEASGRVVTSVTVAGAPGFRTLGSVAADGSGGVWATLTPMDKAIEHVTSDGRATRVPVSGPVSRLASAGNGQVWLAHLDGTVAHLGSDGTEARAGLAVTDSGIDTLIADEDDSAWLAWRANGAAQLARVDKGGSITRVPLPPGWTFVSALAASHHTVWAADGPSRAVAQTDGARTDVVYSSASAPAWLSVATASVLALGDSSGTVMLLSAR